MSAPIKDQWLWLALGVAFLAVSYVNHEVTRRIQTTAADETEADWFSVEPSTKESRTLSLSTLGTLMRSPNPNISETARELIMKRLRNPSLRAAVMSSIEHDSSSADGDLRRRALLTWSFLEEEQHPGMIDIGSPPSSAASTTSQHLIWGQAVDVEDAAWSEASVPFAGWTAIPRERPLPDERDIRRRRREAVVLHEGSGEINENDIIRPVGRRHSG